MYNKIACIGSREAPPDVLKLMEDFGAYLAKKGDRISTGNAPGADQAYARGANKIDPTKVDLYIPWPDFEKQAVVTGNVVIATAPTWWFDEAKKHHPRWDALSQGAKKLHARNIGIGYQAKATVYWANPNKVGGGGTGQAVRYSAANKIPLFDLAKPDIRALIEKKVYG